MKRCLVALICLGALLAACSRSTATPIPTPTAAPPTQTPPAVAGTVGSRITLVPSWTPTIPATPTPMPSATPIPSATLSPSPVPTRLPGAGPVFDPQTRLSAQDFADPQNDLLHNLILFTSDTILPWPVQLMGRAENASQRPNSIVGPQLWAFSPDGQVVGRLTEADRGFESYLPAEGRPVLVQYGIFLNHPDLWSLPLPPECQQAACTHLHFSPNGRTLIASLDPEGAVILVMDTVSGAYQSLSPDMTPKTAEFLPDGRLLIFAAYGETGEAFVHDPVTNTSMRLGQAGRTVWNPQRNVLAVQAQVYLGLGSAVWGFNTATGLLFVPAPAADTPWDWDSHLAWTPGGQYLLYLHRSLARQGDQVTFDGTRKVMLVDAIGGTRMILLGDEQYDYHFCAGADAACAVWKGDWVQVLRTPFEALTVDEQDLGLFDDPAVQCRLYGMGCAEVDLLGLNWRTGEVLPWEDVPAPAATPAPGAAGLPPGPDLGRLPIYADPQGTYAFYLGQDGASLWMVPQQGDPQLWVAQGRNFFYLP